jgi:hypothetical protein
MVRVRDASGDEVVAAFLRAEVSSGRFGRDVRARMQQFGLTSAHILQPDLTDAAQNDRRASLLADWRGWPSNKLVFTGVPADTRWSLEQATPDDVLGVRHIRSYPWIELSNGTLRPTESAASISRVPAGHPFATLIPAVAGVVATLTRGEALPELILLRDSSTGTMACIEGNMRLAAYASRLDLLPNGVQAFVGSSCRARAWAFWKR